MSVIRLDTLTMLSEEAESGYIKFAITLTKEEATEMKENGFDININDDGNYIISWENSEKPLPVKLREKTYHYWKEFLYPIAEEEAMRGWYMVPLNDYGLLATGASEFETDGFTVKLDSTEKYISALYWDKATQGKAKLLRNAINRDSQKVLNNFIKRENLMRVPTTEIEIRRIVYIPGYMKVDDVLDILHQEFNYLTIKRISQNDNYYLIDYV